MTPTVTVGISDSVPVGAALAADTALARWVGAQYAAGRKVAVDAALCPALWSVVDGALRAEGARRADVRVTLDFPSGWVVTFDGKDYRSYANRWAFSEGYVREGPTRRFPGVG